jgi:ribosome-binding factor A
LQSAKGVIRREVGRNLQLRYVPDIEFFFDDSLGHADHIEGLLRQIRDSET